MIEPAAGADRATLAFLVDAYDVEEVEGRQRTVLRLHPRLAPVKVAVLPLVSKEGMPEKAREIFEELRRRVPAEFDEGGSIGKRYRRQDEIGTPWGITVDHQTMEDDTVTLRDRDSLEQARVPIAGLADELAEPPGPALAQPEAGLRASDKRPAGLKRRVRRVDSAWVESSDPPHGMTQAPPPGPYGKEGRIGRGWRLTKVAWSLIRRDRTMVVLAFVGIAGATVFTALIFVLGGFFSHSGDGGNGRFGLVATIAFYPSVLVSVFFNVALASAASAAFDGERMSAGEAIRIAWGKRGRIAAWSLISALVGAIIAEIASRLPGGAEAVGWLAGSAWGLATIFVVPILAMEGTGAVSAVKRSAGLVKSRWGEGLRATSRSAPGRCSSRYRPAYCSGSAWRWPAAASPVRASC